MSKRRRKEPEVVITISDGTDVTADSDRPGWLPDGWDRVSKRKNNRDVSFYYPCPTCVGITFQTQDEVLRHCLFSCEDALKSQTLLKNVQELATPRQLRHANESPPLKDGQKSGSFEEGGQFGNGLFDSIPRGWIIEIRRGSEECGKMYKFYVDPTKEYRFSSKEEVQFYHKEGKPLHPASNEIFYCNTKSKDNILAEMEFSPESLPYGWIKETQYRHVGPRYKKGIRKDNACGKKIPDPESGFVFCTLKGVERYLQTGEVTKRHGLRVADAYSFESSSEMPEYLARRFGLSRCTSGHTCKKSIDDADGDGADDEEHRKDLMTSPDGVLQTGEFIDGGNQHKCHTEVGTDTEIVGYKETISTVEQNQRKGSST